jgi:hypothetical protein
MTGGGRPIAARRCGAHHTTLRPLRWVLRNYPSPGRPRAAAGHRSDGSTRALGYQLDLLGVYSLPSSCCVHILFSSGPVSGAKSGGRLSFCYCHPYGSSERSGPYGSYAVHALAECSRSKFTAERSAEKLLEDLVAWLISITAIIISGASQLL